MYPYYWVKKCVHLLNTGAYIFYRNFLLSWVKKYVHELNSKLYFFLYIGIIWRKDDPHVLYSSSRDCYLYQHVFKDAKRPADELVPAGLDMSIHGDISYATLEKPDLTGKCVLETKNALVYKILYAISVLINNESVNL